MQKVFIFYFLVKGFIVFGQSAINSYNFGRTPQAALQNPSYDLETDYHLTIPFLGSNRINIESSGMTVYDLFADNTIPFQDKVRNTVYQMSEQDFLMVNQRMEIINLGKRLNNSTYISAGFYEEFDYFSTFPIEVMHLFFEGTSLPGKSYKFDDFVAQTSLLGVYHLGLQKKVTKKLDIGARIKLYNAPVDMQAVSNKGNFRTEINDDGMHIHRLSEIDVLVHTSGFAVQFDDENDVIRDAGGNVILEDRKGNDLFYEDYIKPGHYINKAFFVGNKGLGVDLGITYQASKHINLAASINDLGALFNTKQIRNYAYKGEYVTEAIAFDYDPDIAVGYVQLLKDDFDEQVPLDVTDTNYISWRPFHVNTLMTFTFGKRRKGECNYFKSVSHYNANLFGTFLHAQNRPRQILYDASVFYERNFDDLIQARISYSMNKYNYTNIGLSASAHFWKLNIFAGINNVLGLTNLAKAHNISTQLGVHVMIK